MRVRELIAALEAQDPEAHVILGLMTGDEEGPAAVVELLRAECLTAITPAMTDEEAVRAGAGYVTKGPWPKACNFVTLKAWWGPSPKGWDLKAAL